MKLIILPNESSVDRGAVCLDGSPPALLFRPSTTSADKNKWVLYIKGGGWCYDEADCVRRSKTIGSGSTNGLQTGGFNFGLLDGDPARNPTFAHANHAELWYCDGGSFTGDRASPVVVNGTTLYFRGKRVLDALLDYLMLRHGLSEATEVLLSGGSAGGLSTFLHADYIRSRFGPEVKFGAAPVSGFFLMHGNVEGEDKYPAKMRYIYRMMNSSGGLNRRCMASFAQAPGDSWRCIFANYSYAHTQAPVFPLQSSVDHWQMGSILGLDAIGPKACTTAAVVDGAQHQLANCTTAQRRAVVEYQRAFLRDLKASPAFSRPGNGGYVESCVEHCAGQGKEWNTYRNGVSGLTMQQALTAWWDSGLDAPAEQHWQLPCLLHESGDFGQCNPTCTAAPPHPQVVETVPAPQPQARTCASDADCYGGKCLAAGKCACPPLWTGPQCQTLRLKPARTSTPGLLLPETSTWGGGAVEDEAGRWHMFAARIEAHCGLHSWGQNSEIVHATASAPDGPYEVEGVVLPAFSHGPAPALLPDGRVVIGHLGCGNGTQPLVRGCSNGTTPPADAGTTSLDPAVAVAGARPPGKSNCDWGGWKGVLLSADAAGASFSGKKWKQLANWSGYGLVVQAGPGSWHNGDAGGSVVADNPSFWPLANGSFLLAYANKLKHPVGPGTPKWTGHKHVGLAIGELPIDGGPLRPFRDITREPVFPYEAEDPNIFFDATNNLTTWRWHMLAHRLVSNISREVCAHAVAESPSGPWKVAATPAYTTAIDWAHENGAVTTQSVQGRERPRIILDRAGRPVALSTGTTPGVAPTPITPHGYTGDFSYTLVQMLDPVAPTPTSSKPPSGRR